tara:strand:+ start:743 stop:1111 length:369 start_codon:yes stop_codon:yes gene_type:complete
MQQIKQPRTYEFWDKETGFYGYDKYSEIANESTKNIQNLLQKLIDKGYMYSIESSEGYDIYPLTKNAKRIKLSQSIDDESIICIYKDRQYIGFIAFNPEHDVEESISNYSVKLDEIINIEDF